jgi:peptide-methionine (S)-S-oxide reductase
MPQETAIFAGGCFWCTEAIFDRLEGVESVESGYIGGHLDNPTYRQVCDGNTGHAEAVKITYDPSVITYDELLDIFFHTHDPTQLNRQGNDVGTQYRSSVFYLTLEQKTAAEAARDRAQVDWDGPIVTRFEPVTRWYPAEDYHQEYFERSGGSNPYCQAVVAPKLAKFRKSYAARLKKAAA